MGSTIEFDIATPASSSWRCLIRFPRPKKLVGNAILRKAADPESRKLTVLARYDSWRVQGMEGWLDSQGTSDADRAIERIKEHAGIEYSLGIDSMFGCREHLKK